MSGREEDAPQAMKARGQRVPLSGNACGVTVRDEAGQLHDLSKNCVPFCLLREEVRSALRAYEGPLVYLIEDRWAIKRHIPFYKDVVYRVAAIELSQA